MGFFSIKQKPKKDKPSYYIIPKDEIEKQKQGEAYEEEEEQEQDGI
jgi:hypothetical protein